MKNQSHFISFHFTCSWRPYNSFHIISFVGEMSIWWVLMKEFVNRVSSFFGDTVEQERGGKCVLRPTNTSDWGDTDSVETVSFCFSRNCHCTTCSSSSSHGWWWPDIFSSGVPIPRIPLFPNMATPQGVARRVDSSVLVFILSLHTQGLCL